MTDTTTDITTDPELLAIYENTSPFPQESIQRAAPQQAEGPGFFGTLGDMGKGVAAGVWDAGAETINLVSDAANLFTDEDNKFGNIVPTSEGYITVETGWGKGAKSISQFAAGFIGAGKFLKAAKLLQGAGKSLVIGRGMAQGALADFTVFDAHEARLSNLVQSSPTFANPITEYLAADPKDGDIEGRFKNTIEGMALGAVGESLVTIVKGIRASRAAKTVAAAEDAVIKLTEELEAIIAKSGKSADELAKSVEAVVTGDTKELAEAVAEAGGKVELNVHGVDAAAAKETVEAVAEHTLDATASSVSPAMKASMTRSRLKPEEFSKTLEDGITAANGKDMSELMEGRFLIGNGKRLEFNTIEEATLHAEHATAVWDKTLLGKGQETFRSVLDGSQEFLRFLGVDDLLDSAAKDRAWMKNMTSRVLAYKEVAQSAGEEILDIRRLINLHGETPELLERLSTASRIYQDLSLSAKDMITGSARTTSAGRITPRYLDGDVLADVLAAAEGNLEQVAKVINMSRSRRTFSTIQELVINGLLSGPKTHLVNVSGNFLKSILMPVDKMLGGAMTADKQMMQEGVSTLFSLHKYLGESWIAARKAYLTGDNILDAGHKIMDASSRHPIMTTFSRIEKDMLTKLKAAGKDVSGGLPPWMELQARFRSFIGLPSRALLTMDEFFKQINYRANITGKLTAEGMAKNLDSNALAEFVENGMRNAFDEAGRGIDASALRYGQEATWTQTLKDGAYFNVGEGVTNMVNTVPAMRLVIPFIKTPTNLIHDFVAHTPGLNLTTKRFHDAMREGGEAKAHALGAMATGSMLWISAISLAMSGKITGGYPKDPASRQAWIDSGIEPYSFRLGDTYLSFAKLDPFSTFFGIAADYAEYSRNWEDASKGNWASGALAALSYNIMSKSYLTGLTDIMAAASDTSVDSKAMQKYLQRSTTMFIPYSSGLRFTRQLTDDPMREVRSIFDAMLNTIPGISSSLPERRSWITGKGVSNNVFWGTHKNDLVTNEIARLGDNLSIGAPGRTLKGVELNSAQYSRLCELQGTIKLGGVTQHERLERLMKSTAYDMGRKRFQDMPGNEGNQRTKMVEQIVRAYREAAQKSILREDTALRTAANNRLKASIAARRGERDKFVQLLTMPK